MTAVNIIKSDSSSSLGLATTDFVFSGDIDGRAVAGNTFDHGGKTWLHVYSLDADGNPQVIDRCRVEVEKTEASVKAAIEAHYFEQGDLDAPFQFDGCGE